MLFKAAAAGRWQGFVMKNGSLVVSIITAPTHAHDALSTLVINGTQVKLYAW
jgi:hypothetical protein